MIDVADFARDAEQQSRFLERFSYRCHGQRTRFARRAGDRHSRRNIGVEFTYRPGSVILTFEQPARKHVDAGFESRLAAAAPHQYLVMGVTLAIDDETGCVAWTNGWHLAWN